MSIKAHMTQFKKMVCFIAQIWMTEFDQLYFNASHAPHGRLAEVSILQNTPSIKAIPNFPEGVAKSIMQALLTAKGKTIVVFGARRKPGLKPARPTG